MDQYIKAYQKLMARRAVEVSMLLVALGILVGWFAAGLRENECPIERADQILVEDLGQGKMDEPEGQNEVSIIEPSEYEVEGTSQVVGAEKCVDVSGAVEKPGVYCLRGEPILIEAVEKAGGFKAGEFAGRYVAQTVNLAKDLTDGMKLYIPFQEEVRCKMQTLNYVEVELGGSRGEMDAEGDDTDPSLECVNINTATKDELITLDGIGEVSALAIIEHRPYESIEDLLDVSGIGQAKLDGMKPKLCEM